MIFTTTPEHIPDKSTVQQGLCESFRPAFAENFLLLSMAQLKRAVDASQEKQKKKGMPEKQIHGQQVWGKVS